MSWGERRDEKGKGRGFHRWYSRWTSSLHFICSTLFFGLLIRFVLVVKQIASIKSEESDLNKLMGLSDFLLKPNQEEVLYLHNTEASSKIFAYCKLAKADKMKKYNTETNLFYLERKFSFEVIFHIKHFSLSKVSSRELSI
ncbi:unnamed protein product [Onchocerca flexuosa]|uniref:Uncharacterized protein n=1 Tax=Onchocerca flexuosa TaxID=387005 RepID=A0A183I3L5_9BILA|nr:unnamed protein product [Onchocerca flexuosa]